MTYMRRAVSALLMLSLLCAWGALAEGGFTLTVEGGSLVGGYYELKQNDTLGITPVKTGAWANAVVAYSSSNENVATVLEGVVFASATATGTATITAAAHIPSTGERASESINVWVIKGAAPVTTVSVRGEGGATSLSKGGTLQMIADVTPAGVSVKWKSSRPAVASIDKDGLVKALAAGKTQISATAQDGSGAKAMVTLTIGASAAQSLKLSASRMKLYVGGVTRTLKRTGQLSAKVKPADSRPALTWSSSAPNVVGVKQGKLLAKKAGNATITATTDAGLSASCEVVVDRLPTKIGLPKRKAVQVGKTVNLKAELKMDGTADVRWRSLNPRIAQVQNGVVKGIRAGKARIGVKTVNGKVAVCAILVTGGKGTVGWMPGDVLDADVNAQIEQLFD
ncbi:Ig-like domain-containing protein [Bacillota bacterium Meth-B3]